MNSKEKKELLKAYDQNINRARKMSRKGTKKKRRAAAALVNEFMNERDVLLTTPSSDELPKTDDDVQFTAWWSSGLTPELIKATSREL